MARRRDEYEDYEDVEPRGERSGAREAGSPWADTRVIVTVVVAVGVLAIVGALVYRIGKSKELRLQRIADHKKLGSRLVREVHAIGVEYFSGGRKDIAPGRWDAVRKEPELVDAILVELDDFQEHFIAAANYGPPRLEKYRGTEDLRGGVKLTRGRIVTAGTRIPVWLFELHILNDKHLRLGKAMVCLKRPKEDEE